MVHSFSGMKTNCSRRGKAVRLSYDHKGTDEAEGRRIAAAGGLILNSRVNGISFSSNTIPNDRCFGCYTRTRRYLYERLHIRPSFHNRNHPLELIRRIHDPGL
jgi:serine/threonine protein phosphatase PrpC